METEYLCPLPKYHQVHLSFHPLLELQSVFDIVLLIFTITRSPSYLSMVSLNTPLTVYEQGVI